MCPEILPEMMPISQVRKKLPLISRRAKQMMKRCVITKNGTAESVILSIDDLRGLEATIELLQRPHLMKVLDDASADLRAGRRKSMAEARAYAGLPARK